MEKLPLARKSVSTTVRFLFKKVASSEFQKLQQGFA